VLRACDELFVAVVKGNARRKDVDLAEGDLGIFRRTTTVNLAGDGLAVVAVLAPEPCKQGSKLAEQTVIRGGATPKLSWANDQMEAHLDAESDVSPNAYVGRLAGYAGVGEHAHAGSWEVLCAVDANGTFVVGNVTRALHARQVVIAPPGVNHAWQPVAGSWLQAVQFYVPPGPEQRFKVLGQRR
jgi:hypothetical protein